jgi:hypothetical protein
VGVDRQYSGTLGKTGSCQVAVSLHHAGEQGRLGPRTWSVARRSGFPGKLSLGRSGS